MMGRCVNHLARCIHGPAMKDAAQYASFVAGQRHRDAAMGTGLVDKADLAVRRPEGDIVDPEEANLQGRIAGGKLCGDCEGKPGPVAQQRSHRCLILHTGKLGVLLGGQHNSVLLPWT